MDYIHRDKCRLCDSNDLVNVLSLTPTPPANAFINQEKLGIQQKCYPLDLYFCNLCCHLQLLDIVSPEILFRDYVYVSGTSPVFVKHFEDYSNEVIDYINPEGKELIVDIGSNDGTLLRCFKNKGYSVLGIDPAIEIAKSATESGIQTINGFFNESLAKEILVSHGKARVITANNVFAHIDDIKGVINGVKQILSNNGIFIFEVSYLLKLYEDSLFDMIYHEHLDYHSIIPLVKFFENNAMRLVKVKNVNTHGGSIRCYVQFKDGNIKVDNSVTEYLNQEKVAKLDDAKTFVDFSKKIDMNGEKLKSLLIELKSKNKKIAGFGAPAKATTLMYHYGIDSKYIDFIIDDSPLKQGLYTPGHHIPVLDSTAINEQKPDYLLILAWNFAESIIAKNKQFRDAGGQFIIPLPTLEVI